MMSPGQAWNEAGQSEGPAVTLLDKLGYDYATPKALESERGNLRDVVLVHRLKSALKKLNPWIGDNNLHKAVRTVTNVPAANLIEANEVLYTALSYGIALEQDLGEGRKSQQVRFFDFDAPTRNEFLVTWQYRVKGAKKHIIPDVVCFVNGIPLAVIECKSPTLGDGWRAEAIDQLDRYQELSEKYKELGAPLLFQSVQINIATCGQDAVYGTVATSARFYLRWKRTYPMTSTQVGQLVGKDEPTPQDVTIAGLLSRENLRAALPNAVFFGFTGTPIDKKDRSTISTFGPYIDQYTIEQAVADEATVPIFYESRMADLKIIGQTLDQVFDRVFADRSDEERAKIKHKYANEQDIAAAPKRIEAICLDLIEHYTNYIEPGGFKAQIVTPSRKAAVAYKDKLDELNGPCSVVLMSDSNKDDANLVAHHTSTDERKQFVRRFLKKDDPLKILIVCDMLLTGFDAPIEQVMYLDSPLKEHTVLQAIARVNRTADHKDYGLIVDYWGVSEALQEALAIFSPSDIQGAMEPKTDELPRLQSRREAAMRFFVQMRDKSDLAQCVAVLEPEDVRAEFQTAFRRFSSQERQSQGERDGARHPPRDPCQARGRSSLLSNTARTAPADHRGPQGAED